MRIEHVAMYVNDLKAAKNFFEKYLGASANEGYHNKTTDFRSYFLTFDDGARLEIMNHARKRQLSENRRALHGAELQHDRRRTQQHAHPTHAPGAGRKTAG